MTTPTAADRQAYREALAACFDLVMQGPDANRQAVQVALRRVDRLETLGVGAVEAQRLRTAMVAEYIASNDTCPYCGGAPHDA